MVFSENERKILKSVAEVLVPPGRFFEEGGSKGFDGLERFISGNRVLKNAYRHALKILDVSSAILPPFKRFTNLSREKREKILKNWLDGNIFKRAIADLLCETVKASQFSDEGVYSRLGCVWDKSPKNVLTERYMKQVKNPAELGNGEVIECDVVVVGTGAGGAVVAKELAEKGLAVLIIEEGKYWGRKDFSGKLVESTGRFYQNSGFTYTLGNCFILLPMGRMVGGSTAINTGTSWRTPEWILERWVKEFGLTELSSKKLEPYFRRVEETIQVEQTKDKVIGGIARVIARGCDVLGYRHYPVKRNAPECDGQGVCTLGCPTDARRSMNVSYIPLALNSNALLLVETKAKRILVEGDRAVGLEAEGVQTGRKIIAKSKAVILSAGAIMSPALLLSQGICNSSRLIGRNLTIHPGVGVFAMFEDDDISCYKYTPQGYCVDTFHREGILFLGAGLQIDAGAAAVPFVGSKFSEVMSNFNHLASFGVMIEDSPSGRVFMRRAGKKPFIFYWLGKRELSLLKRGVDIMAKIFLTAGAKEVYPLTKGFDIISSWNDYAEFSERSFSPLDYRIVAFHPLGTCRMGIDPKTSVVSQSHETHDIKNLYICDGSVLPTSIAVNPQETIMALSTRAAFEIMKKLE